MQLEAKCRLEFEISVPTPFLLMLRPRSGAQQWIASEEYKLTPNVPVVEFTDTYGNLCQRLVAQAGKFSIGTRAEVMTADHIDRAPGAPFVEIQELPDQVLTYLLPSRYCESDRFHTMSSEITQGAAPGYDQVAAIERWLREKFQFAPDQIGVPLSAVEVNQRQTLVCRDLAHLGIALCRSLSIPARMVVGYLHGLEPMDMHAWFEAYVGNRWYTFDATQDSLRGGYLVLAYGRDAADVAVYTQYGPAVFPDFQEISVRRIDVNN